MRCMDVSEIITAYLSIPPLREVDPGQDGMCRVGGEIYRGRDGMFGA